MIADFLNPRANHGQGPLFLEGLLAKLKLTERWLDLDPVSARVSVERVITGQRRIDIHVKMHGGSTEYCLAIENKPYASDQENQVRDYLEHLAGSFDDRFLLMYLSPRGEPPTDWSLPRSDLDQWTGRLAIVPFHGQDDSERAANKDDTIDVYEAFRASFSLNDWLNTCHDKCRVERLRWFLRDAQLFCQRTFGDHHMTTDSEARAVEEFLLSNPENLSVAFAVYESWPTVRDHVCRGFLEQVRGCIEQKVKLKIPDCAQDAEIGCRYFGVNKGRSHLWLYRTSWKKYGAIESHTRGRTYVFLEADSKKEPIGWYFGVASPLQASKMTECEHDRRTRLDKQLKDSLGIGGKWSEWSPQEKYVDDQFRNWNGLVPDLSKECNAGGGEITDYFVDRIVDVVIKAFPVIDEIEGSSV